MTTSGTVTFSRTRDQLIKGALRKLGIYAEGETPTAQQISDGADDLNMMIKTWKAMGINLWCYEEIAVFPVIGQQSYQLGTGGDRAASVYAVTSITAPAITGASTITLASVTGIANTYNIGVVLDAGTIQWTTVNGAPSGLVVTLTATLTSPASAGNLVYVYQTQVTRPLRVIGGRIKIANGNEIPMKVRSRQHYMSIPIKSTKGKPTELYYDPQLDLGVLYIWATIQYINDFVIVTAQREIQDFNTLSDTADLPQEWYEPIVYNLAVRMAPDYGIDDATFNRISAMAEGFLDNAKDFDQEATSITFTPMMDE